MRFTVSRKGDRFFGSIGILEQTGLFLVGVELYSAVCENKTTGINRSFLHVLGINISIRILGGKYARHAGTLPVCQALVWRFHRVIWQEPK